MFEGGRGWARVFWVGFGHVRRCLRVGAGGRGCSGLGMGMSTGIRAISDTSLRNKGTGRQASCHRHEVMDVGE